MFKVRDFNFLVTHIYGEENPCADKLVNLDFLVSSFTWWTDINTDVALDFT